MIVLVLSILSSTLIFVIFKLFTRFQINTFQAIVVNYFTAFTLGVLLFGGEWNPEAAEHAGWGFSVILVAIFFIGLFVIMGKSSQINGVAATSVAVKMSMAVSIVMMILWFSEAVNHLKIIGVVLAFTGVYLISAPSPKTSATASAPWMLVVLFLGSGCLDFLIRYVENTQLEHLSAALFSSFGFGLAGVIGLLVLLIQGRTTFAWKNVIAGITLGIPNYFSIYLLILSYQTTGWDGSTVLTVTNVSVVLGSAIAGFVIFKEHSNFKKLIGLACAILAIAVLYISNF